MLARPLSLKPLAHLLATAGLLAMALPVHATLVVDGLTATADITVNGTPTADGPNSSGTSVSAYATDLSDAAYNGPTHSGTAKVEGDAGGFFGVVADGSGNFDSTARFVRTWDITNDSTVAQNYSFSFLVYGGSINAYTSNGSGSGFASYLLDIGFGGSSLFNSRAQVDSNAPTSFSGTALNVTDSGPGYYNWSDTVITLNLGVLYAGDSAQLRYDLVSHAFGDYNNWCASGSSYVLDGYLHTGCFAGSSFSRFGDPGNISGTPVQNPTITARPVSANAVPEPGTLALLGLGLTAALGLRRRQPRG